MWMHALCVHMPMWLRCQLRTETSELQEAASYQMWVLRTKLRLSARAKRALNSWAIFPAPLILFFLMYSGLLFPIFGEKYGYGTLDFLGSLAVNDRWFLSLNHLWLQALSYQTPQLLSVAEIYFIQTNKANGLFSYALLSWVIILPLTHFGFSVFSFPACYNFLSGASLT